MQQYAIIPGTINNFLRVFVADTRRQDGGGLTGLVYDSSGLSCYYFLRGAAAAVEIPLIDTALGNHADGGLKQIDATNMPGWYELQAPDACAAAGFGECVIVLCGAANMAQVDLRLRDDYLDDDLGNAAPVQNSLREALMAARAAAKGTREIISTAGGKFEQAYHADRGTVLSSRQATATTGPISKLVEVGPFVLRGVPPAKISFTALPPTTGGLVLPPAAKIDITALVPSITYQMPLAKIDFTALVPNCFFS